MRTCLSCFQNSLASTDAFQDDSILFSALTPHRATIEEEFRRHPPHTAHQAARRIEELTGVQRKPSRVRKFLKEDLGMRCLKVAPIPVPPKKTVEEHARTQADFLKDGPGTEVGRGAVSGRCISWMPRTSCWRHSWDGCGASFGSMCGTAAVQRAGSVERGHARVGHRNQHHVHHGDLGVRVAPQDREPGRVGADHVGAGQRPLLKVCVGHRRGQSVGDRVVVLAVVFAQPEPDRAAVEVREEGSVEQPPPSGLQEVSGRHRRLPDRSANEAPKQPGDSDDPQLPNVGRCVTPERVKYSLILETNRDELI